MVCTELSESPCVTGVTTRREVNVLGKEGSAEAAERAAPTPAPEHRHRKMQMIPCHTETPREVIYSPDLEEPASVLTGR